jgi:hypothetical protein
LRPAGDWNASVCASTIHESTYNAEIGKYARKEM